jgi:hypothetical protein
LTPDPTTSEKAKIMPKQYESLSICMEPPVKDRPRERPG